MAAKKSNTKAVSNEEIIAALLQHGTVREAAEAAGTTPRTIYDRMSNDKEYNDKLRRQLTKSLNGYRRIEKGITEALKALNDIEQAQEPDILT